jgi:dolichyl-phosphate-mannose-protein mannosyltransferase
MKKPVRTHLSDTTGVFTNDFARARAAFGDSVLLFIISVAFFLWNIQFPGSKNFDEFHYIPSALQWISLTENQNWEHPPLAKLLISLGIRLFGDEPFGWRFMPAIFGGLTLVGMYRFAYELFGKSRRAAWICAMLTLANQLLYVQARIAMLDTFMMAFLAWGLWYFIVALDEFNFEARFVIRAGVFMGLAVACKWFALVPWVMCGALLLFQAYRLRSLERTIDFFLYWLVLPAVVYVATFLPYLYVAHSPPYTVWELLTEFQTRMLDGQKRVVNSHPYMSQFTDWILMKRPIWYAFDKDVAKPDMIRGVLLLGNPLIMWGGLLAILGLVVEVLRKRAFIPFMILYFYFGFALCWIAIPRKVAFYYYYYPAGMMLGVALTYWIYRVKRDWFTYAALGTAFGFFIYFFPILSAQLIPADSFTQWMWLRSWI